MRGARGHQRRHGTPATASACTRASAAIEELSLELARQGIALRALVPDAASLEERFFALTEDPAPAAAPAAVPELEQVA